MEFLSRNTSLRSFKVNCNRFTDAVYDDFKRCLLQNKYLDVFEVFNNFSKEGSDSREMELAEIILKKSTERKGNTFVSVANFNRYLDDQAKIKETRLNASMGIEKSNITDESPKSPDAPESQPKEAPKESEDPAISRDA